MPPSFSYTLIATSGSVAFSISGLPSWLTASPTSGTASTKGTTVKFTVNANADKLATNTYPATINFINKKSGQGTQTRPATLIVNLPVLQVTPATNIVASGKKGGPFSPSSFSYTLSASGGSVNYAIINAPTWLTASSTSGTVTTAKKTITFKINSSADNLTPSTYVGSINFNNTTSNGGSTIRAATLTVK
jgi:hypothetical protein